MLNDSARWSLPRGNSPVPSRWQATPGIDWRTLRRRYLTGEPGWRPEDDGITLFVPQRVQVTRYRWRGYNIPTPWTRTATA
jgi:hypothetical protein